MSFEAKVRVQGEVDSKGMVFEGVNAPSAPAAAAVCKLRSGEHASALKPNERAVKQEEVRDTTECAFVLNDSRKPPSRVGDCK